VQVEVCDGSHPYADGVVVSVMRHEVLQPHDDIVRVAVWLSCIERRVNVRGIEQLVQLYFHYCVV
jgi:hypothetical protein